METRWVVILETAIFRTEQLPCRASVWEKLLEQHVVIVEALDASRTRLSRSLYLVIRRYFGCIDEHDGNSLLSRDRNANDCCSSVESSTLRARTSYWYLVQPGDSPTEHRQDFVCVLWGDDWWRSVLGTSHPTDPCFSLIQYQVQIYFCLRWSKTNKIRGKNWFTRTHTDTARADISTNWMSSFRLNAEYGCLSHNSQLFVCYISCRNSRDSAWHRTWDSCPVFRRSRNLHEQQQRRF